MLFKKIIYIFLLLLLRDVQVGNCDCGLFAIAFATAVAYGKDPSQCNFDQAKMREHLYKCFSGRKLLPFPENIAILIKNNIQSSTDDIAVHCYCRMPELKDVPMIECSSCFKWFHVACCHDSITDEQLKELDTMWCCQVCQ